MGCFWGIIPCLRLPVLFFFFFTTAPGPVVSYRPPVLPGHERAACESDPDLPVAVHGVQNMHRVQGSFWRGELNWMCRLWTASPFLSKSTQGRKLQCLPSVPDSLHGLRSCSIWREKKRQFTVHWMCIAARHFSPIHYHHLPFPLLPTMISQWTLIGCSVLSGQDAVLRRVWPGLPQLLCRTQRDPCRWVLP